MSAQEYTSAKPDPVASFTVHVAGHMNGEQSHVQDMIALVKHYVGLTVSDAKMLDMDRLGTTLECSRNGQSFKVRLPFVRCANRHLLSQGNPQSFQSISHMHLS